MKVSIFIPVYNGEGYLSRTLDSVLGQTYHDLEVLCVDDSSTDGSYSLLQDYASRDSRMRIFHKSNGGDVPHSWQFVIPHIRGAKVLYMSQDDLLENDTLELLIQRQQETGADAILPHEIHYREGIPMNQLHHLRGIAGDISPVISGRDAFRLMIDYSISGRALWPTNIIREIGIRTDTFNADELAQRQWIYNCPRVAFSDAKFLYCRDNPEAITTRLTSKYYSDVLTNTYLFSMAEEVLSDDRGFVDALGNKYFYRLYQRMINFAQHKREYTHDEQKNIKNWFKKAYLVLHGRNTMSNWKYRFSDIAYPLMCCITEFKGLQLKQRGIILYHDLD